MDSPGQPQRPSEAGRGEQDRPEMYGRIRDIWRGNGQLRKTDGVNNRGVGVRREINGLKFALTRGSPIG